MSKNKKDFGNIKTLTDLADLADDWVAISWKTKIWKFKMQKNSRGLLETTEKSAKSAQSARAYF